MKIALLSDSHNSWKALERAVEKASDKECDVMFFAGDLTRPKGVGILTEFSGPVHQIIGNIDHNIDTIWARADKTDNVIFHGEVCDIERSGVRIFMHHQPEPADKRASQEPYDLCIHGHLHEFRHEQFASVDLINPGALTRRSSSPEWAIFNTETRSVERFTNP